ncbi:MAG: amidophosphoribosyltransferase [Lachnospiraceae bacterium]|nr:amidophosphoribosyltransferase [Lachnospiraceae bacterium]
MQDICSDKLHEECGVFGIYGEVGKNVAKEIYYGLVGLQHRGQESAGISVSDTEGELGNVLTVKGMGLVSEVFSEETLAKMKGNIGVGHVRYSTTGGSVPENAQPISMNYIKGSLSLVHNGNIVNASELKDEQMLRGQAHYTSSDSEVLAYEIISERLKCGSIEEAVKGAAKKLRGGYAIIVMSPRKLVAFRDPSGLKPLVIGKRDGAYILASESAAIHDVGGELIRDVRPGEIITVTAEGLSTDTELCEGRVAHCIFEYIYFGRSDSVIDGIPVREARFRAGQALAGADKVEADIVCGVPDSGLIAAEGYAAAANLPLTFVFHKNSYIGRSFIKPTDEERQQAVNMKLNVHASAVKGKRVVIIDDSIVRGTTMRKIIAMLRAAGAAQVHVRISSPPFLFPCYYGTDVPSAGQLIAAKHGDKAEELTPSADASVWESRYKDIEKEVKERIGADSLAYLKIKDFTTMVGDLPLCTACFSGEYPA